MNIYGIALYYVQMPWKVAIFRIQNAINYNVYEGNDLKLGTYIL